MRDRLKLSKGALSFVSWKREMADNWFFAGAILGLEAWALVGAAERAAHSQQVHDCVLCFTRRRSHRYVCRATSGSASDGYIANSTAVTGAADM